MEIGSTAATHLYQTALDMAQPLDSPAEAPGLSGPLASEGAPSFADSVAAVAQETIDTIVGGEQAANDMVAGKADPHSVVEALAQTEMALEMAVTVRDRVVSAYQEILRMPV